LFFGLRYPFVILFFTIPVTDVAFLYEPEKQTPEYFNFLPIQTCLDSIFNDYLERYFPGVAILQELRKDNKIEEEVNLFYSFTVNVRRFMTPFFFKGINTFLKDVLLNILQKFFNTNTCTKLKLQKLQSISDLYTANLLFFFL
jgi:hypothetical protein